MESGFEIVFCRQCRNALYDVRSIEEDVREIARQSRWSGRKSHEKIKAGFSACPNSCASPQIKDFGIVAFITPELNPEACISCGRCLEACREEAVRFTDHPEFGERCIGCGDCVRACPTGAISGNVRFRVLAGGRLGRHPRFAEEVAVISKLDEAISVFRLVVSMSEESRTRFSHIHRCVDVLKERIGAEVFKTQRDTNRA